MNNKNKNFWKILVVLLLSILHVCASAYTVNNAMNPLLILLLFTYTAWSEFYTYFIGGMIVQCVVTYFLARLILDWRNKKVWLISFAVCIFIQFLFCDFFTNYDSQLINLPIINMFVEKIGMWHYVNNVIFFSIGQLLFVLLYKSFTFLANIITRLIEKQNSSKMNK